MKEFSTAVDENLAAEERETKIVALVEKGKTREEAEREVDADEYVPFMLDGREMHAYHPNTGQMAFMMANMGRGQSNADRFAAIVNVMLSCLRPEDRDYLEVRLLERDPKKKIPIEKMEEVFAYLSEEWFGRPTQ